MPGATPILQMPYPVPDDTVDVPRDVLALATKIDNVNWRATASPPLVSALPGSPVDGQECYYQNASMAALGVAWHLRYRAGGGTYKWEFIGGSSWAVSVSTDQAISEGAWVDAPTVGPQITVPLVGDYAYTFSMNCYVIGQTASGVITTNVGLSYNGANPTDPHVAMGPSRDGSSGTIGRTGATGNLAAGSTLRLKYLVPNSGGASAPHVRYRELCIQPIRVG